MGAGRAWQDADAKSRAPSSLAASLPLSPLYHPQDGKPDKSSPYIQVLEEDWRQALQDHQEQANTILSLRKDLRQGEALRTRVCSWAKLGWVG